MGGAQQVEERVGPQWRLVCSDRSGLVEHQFEGPAINAILRGQLFIQSTELGWRRHQVLSIRSPHSTLNARNGPDALGVNDSAEFEARGKTEDVGSGRLTRSRVIPRDLNAARSGELPEDLQFVA
jgi:hypothetical protein